MSGIVGTCNVCSRKIPPEETRYYKRIDGENYQTCVDCMPHFNHKKIDGRVMIENGVIRFRCFGMDFITIRGLPNKVPTDVPIVIDLSTNYCSLDLYDEET